MHIFRRAVSIIAGTVLALLVASPAYACTGFIVGKDLTKDGSTLFGRTEDLEQNHPKRLLVHKAGEFKKGSKIQTGWTAAAWTQEKDSLKFTSVSDVTPEEGHFDEAGFNSEGVAVDTTVSAGANDEVLKQPKEAYDEDNGWEESSLATVLLANATSARDGVDLMARMIDKNGMAEGDVIVIGDHKEVWYMELYTGHQYAAMKYPSDKYSVFPNAYWLNKVDCTDTTNYVCSKKLVDVPKAAGTYKETNGSFDPAASYNPADAQTGPHNASRVWSGLKVLDPGNPATVSSPSYPLLNSPSGQFEKVTPAKIMKLQRNRFQGVDNDLALKSQKVAKDRGLVTFDDKPVPGAKYPIGNTNTMEAHFFQLPSSTMPAKLPGTMWQTIGTPQGSPYLPYYGNIENTITPMQSTSHTDPLPKVNGKRPNPSHPYKDDDSSYYWVATGVNLAVEKNRAQWEKPVLTYMNQIEAPLIAKRGQQDAEMAALFTSNPQQAAAKATADFTAVSNNAFEKLKAVKKSIEQQERASLKGLADKAGNSVTGTDVALGTVLTVNPYDASAMKDLDVKQAWNVSLTYAPPVDKTMEVQPKSTIKVTLPLKDTTLKASKDLHLYHIVNSKKEEIRYSIDNGKIHFETASLSPFVLATAKTTTPTKVTPPTVKKTTDKVPAKKTATSKLSMTGTSAGTLAIVALILCLVGLGLGAARIIKRQ